MKIALVLHGKIGGTAGKHLANEVSSNEVLELAYKHNKEHIIDPYKADVFLHSWSIELKDEILSLYQPKRELIQSQIDFSIPDYVRADRVRAFAHFSRWYSFRESLRYSTSMSSIAPDYFGCSHVIVQRFDLCWNITPDFEKMDPKYFWVGNSTLDTNREWSDRWFCTNPADMLKFATLFDCIPLYMKNENELPSSKQYSGISSHQLVKHHAKKLDLKEKFKYNFGGYKQQPNDYNEIRRQYFNDDK